MQKGTMQRLKNLVYVDETRYGYDPRKFDLSRIPDWARFVEAMNYAMMKQFSALEKGGRMAVLMGDIKKKGKLYSMLSEIVKPGTLENIIIKAQHNCFSDNMHYSGSFIPILHEYVMIVRKDNPLMIPILATKRIEADVRDMPGATWKILLHRFLIYMRKLNHIKRPSKTSGGKRKSAKHCIPIRIVFVKRKKAFGNLKGNKHNVPEIPS